MQNLPSLNQLLTQVEFYERVFEKYSFLIALYDKLNLALFSQRRHCHYVVFCQCFLLNKPAY